MLHEWFSWLFQEQQPIVAVALAGIFLVLAVGVLAGQWRRVRVAQVEASLKQQMLDKGMPIADMERVLKASAEAAEEEASIQLTGDPTADKPQLVRILLENGYSGADVERLLRALHEPTVNAPGSKSPAQKAQVLAILIENGLEAEEIERILLVVDEAPSPLERTSA